MRLVSIMSLATLAACASSGASVAPADETQPVYVVGAGATTPIRTVAPVRGVVATSVSLPLEQVWNELPGVYAALGIEPTQVDKASHIFGNAGFKVRGQLGKVPLQRYLDCGSTQGGPNAETYEIHMSVVTRLGALNDGKTAISTAVVAAARPITFAGEYSACKSFGSLETNIARLLEPKSK